MNMNNDKQFPPCPVSTSSKKDEYNDICKITGEECPFYEDEGMSVCKSKAKCLNYVLKKKDINKKEVVKLLFSDTQTTKKSSSQKRQKYSGKSSHSSKNYEVYHSSNEFIKELEEALRKRESQNIDIDLKIKGTIDKQLLHIADEKIDEKPEEISDINFLTKIFEEKSFRDEYKDNSTIEELKTLKE